MFNRDILCDEDNPQACRKCGWNPAVAEERKQEIRKKYLEKSVGAGADENK